MQILRILLLTIIAILAPRAFAFEVHQDFLSASEKPYRLSLEFNQTPKVFVEAIVQLRLVDLSTQQLVQFRRLEFQADMRADGMEHLPVPVDIKEITPGHYQVSNIYFIMGGHWELRIRLELFDGSFQRISLPLDFDPATGYCNVPPND